MLVGQDVSATEILGGLDSFAAVGDDQVLPFQWTRSRLPSLLLTSHPKQSVAVRQPRALRVPVPPPSTRFHGPHLTGAGGAFDAVDATESDVGAADAIEGITADSAATTAHARPNVNTLRRLTKAP